MIRFFLRFFDLGATERVSQEWKEQIQPFLANHPELFDASVALEECYVRALSLFSSRAFQVDEYHGDSMIPLADL